MSDEVQLPGDRLIEQLAILDSDLKMLKPLSDLAAKVDVDAVNRLVNVAARLDVDAVNKLAGELSRLLAIFAPK